MAANIAIIGAGPAGLMAAQTLAQAGYPATVFDAMPSAARKFLQAGRGGLNLTHDDAFDDFVSHYYEAAPKLKPALGQFTADDMRAWAQHFGFETFVGSSGKVYPMDKKAAPLLRAWLHQLKQQGTVFKMRHRWLDWKTTSNQSLICSFATADGQQDYQYDALILALGGGSWPHLGSTGSWVTPLTQQGINVSPLKAANMGFEVTWSAIFKDKFAGAPLKNIQLSFTSIDGQAYKRLGELMITKHGVEGSLIYTHSKYLRELLEQRQDSAHDSEKASEQPLTVDLDLFPHRTLNQLTKQLSAPRGKQSLNAFWKRFGLDGVKASLLREVLSKEQLNNPELIANTLKAFPLALQASRPLVEAISTAGGVQFEAVNEHLMVKAYPGLFCAGEMMDWEAPTGGYLLTGVMAQGQQAALGLINYIESRAD